MDARIILAWIVTGCFVYLCFVFTMYALMAIISRMEHGYVTAQRRTEDFELLASSRFTIPVSVIAPAFNESIVIEPVVRSLLAFDYPAFEVIVVNDGSRDDTLSVLSRVFDLEKREVFYRKQFETAEIRGVYRSRTHPQLVVVDKENGGKADALNAGLNFARYRYVCAVDGDTVYYPHALVESMRFALRDPATVVGVTSTVITSRQPEQTALDEMRTPRTDTRVLTSFQLLDFIRAFVNARLGWTRLNFMLCCTGVFSLWRRDLLVEMGGFSSAFTCEDIELTFRVHERLRRERRPYRIVALPEAVGNTEGPDTVARLISQRARWQRVITETVWAYRRMLFNPRYGAVGMLGAPYYLIVETLAPIFQVLAVISVPLAWWLGVFGWRTFLLFTLIVAFANGILTNVALMTYDRGSGGYAVRDLVRLMILGLVDLVLYRPILIYAQAKGLWDALRGKRDWNKFARNRRASPPYGAAGVTAERVARL